MKAVVASNETKDNVIKRPNNSGQNHRYQSVCDCDWQYSSNQMVVTAVGKGTEFNLFCLAHMVHMEGSGLSYNKIIDLLLFLLFFFLSFCICVRIYVCMSCNINHNVNLLTITL